jgi:PKD repeat protein
MGRSARARCRWSAGLGAALSLGFLVAAALVPGSAVAIGPSAHLAPPRMGVAAGGQDMLNGGAAAQSSPLGTTPVSGMANGTAAWANITSTAGTPPDPRSYGRSFAYDPVDQYSVLFGGYGTGGGYLSDTWTFQHGAWKELTPKTHPTARDHATLAWDPTDGYLVLFGGSGNSGSDSDTWTFLHGNWTELSPSTHPSARWASSLTWDAWDGYLLLFGGCVAGYSVADTWTFLGGVWTQLHPKVSPSARENVALMYDPADNYTVLFGGDNYYAATYSDTWTFSGVNWTELQVSVHPSARTQASIEWDPGLERIVLFGGVVTSGGGPYGDTWSFVHGAWSTLAPSTPPTPRSFGIVSAYPVDNELVLFSGAGPSGDLDDTWVLYQLNLTAEESTDSGVAPLQVVFSADTSEPSSQVSALWQLGDGNSSVDWVVDETYALPGQYYPSVLVSDANGSSATLTFRVLVGPALAATALAAPTVGPAPLTVQCQAIASGGLPPYSYVWQSGNGNQSSASSPSFLYGAPGEYELTVNITDSLGTVEAQSFHIVVNASLVQPLVVGVVDSASSGPAPLTVYFVSTAAGGVGPYRMGWTFGDGTTAASASVNHTYTVPGTYTATLSVADTRDTVSAATATVTVGPGLWVRASVTPASVELLAPVTFNASVGGGSGPYNVFWGFGDGLGSGAINTTHSYSTPGTYPITLRVVDALGTAKTQNFTVVVVGTISSSNPTKGTSTSPAGPSELEVLLIGLAAGVVVALGAVELLRRQGRRRP